MVLNNALTLAFLAFISCGFSTVHPSVPMPVERALAANETTPVIIITVDGVMWQDVFGPKGRELLPNTYHAADTHGTVLGAPGHGGTISASGPNFVSMPGYTELFEGRTHTGCYNNLCDGATVTTVADEVRAQHPDPSSVAVISSWERIADAATTDDGNFVVSAGSDTAQGHPELLVDDADTDQAYLAGLWVPSYPGHFEYRPDHFTSKLALAYLRAHRPSFMFIGLGDTDEYGHRGDRPRYEQAMREADALVGDVLSELKSMGEWGEKTLVLVTADHGRANNFCDHGGDHPESARTWLFALNGPAASGGFVSAPTARHLADIAPTIRAVVGLPPSSGASSGQVMNELLLVR